MLFSDFFQASSATLFFVIVSAIYVQNVITHRKPGAQRIILFLPILFLNLCIPLLFTLDGLLVFGRITWTFLLSWLASNKGLALCLNRGIFGVDAQGKDKQWTTAQFIALYLLPVMPSEESCEGMKKLKELGRLFFYSIGKLFLLLVCYALMLPNEADSLQNTLACGFALYFFLGYLFNSSSFVALLIFDITTIDSFKHPYLASSLTDFWARRWNIMTARVLRTLTYDIVMDGKLIGSENEKDTEKQPVSELRKAVATISVFTLSGILHEAFLWSLGSSIDGEWFAYFFIQGPLLLLEKQIWKLLEAQFGLKTVPKLISIPCFFCMNTLLASLLFVPQARRAGGDELAHLVQMSIFNF